jgi:hypothetical protein
MKKARHLSGCAGSEAYNQSPINKTPPDFAQPKIYVCCAPAPALPRCGNTVTAIFDLVALHLRRTIPLLASLTADDFDTALADLRPQLRALLDDD